MSKPRILIHARREEPPEMLGLLEQAGYELAFGDTAWQLPRGQHEDAFVAAARDAVALMGTSIRHTPISRRIMEASKRLRIVSKYTVGVDGVFTRGRAPFGYLEAFKANLFLSANAGDVRAALTAGFPAAQVYTQSARDDPHPDEVPIAFDGDAVLFADEAERVYRTQGLDAFQTHEADHASRPLPPGPFKPLLETCGSGFSPTRYRARLKPRPQAPPREYIR